MGMILSTTKFAYPAPKPEAIARKASEICGLPIRYQASEHAMNDVHEFSGTFFFEAVTEEKVEVHAYQQGAVKRFDEKLGLPDHPALGKTQGHADDHGVQRVYVSSYFGCELTLFHLTELALLKLGGRLGWGQVAHFPSYSCQPKRLARVAGAFAHDVSPA